MLELYYRGLWEGIVLTTGHVLALQSVDGVCTRIAVHWHSHASTVALIDIVYEEGGKDCVCPRGGHQGGDQRKCETELHSGDRHLCKKG